MGTASSKPKPAPEYARPGDKTSVYLKSVITRPSISVGDFTIYHDFDDPTAFENKNVLYHYPCNNDRLVIGRFSSIACGTRFIMNGANHKAAAVSTYPFAVFGARWDKSLAAPQAWDMKGDIVVGSDVWIGFEVLVMPGVHIADGAIVASRSVVTRDVGPYEIVGGAPAKLIRKRFPDAVVKKLLKLKWWDWPEAKIRKHLSALRGADPSALLKLAVR